MEKKKVPKALGFLVGLLVIAAVSMGLALVYVGIPLYISEVNGIDYLSVALPWWVIVYLLGRNE